MNKPVAARLQRIRYMQHSFLAGIVCLASLWRVNVALSEMRFFALICSFCECICVFAVFCCRFSFSTDLCGYFLVYLVLCDNYMRG